MAKGKRRLRIHDFVQASICSELIRVHETYSVANDTFMAGFRTARFMELRAGRAPAHVTDLVDSIRAKIHSRLCAVFPGKRPMYIQYSGLESVAEGCRFPTHSDNSIFDRAQSRWVRAKDACRVRSAVLYLNTSGVDYDGGVFEFVNRSVFDRSGGLEEVVEDEGLVPRAGSAVLFTAGPENLHRVSPITRGRRYTLAMWLAEDPAVCEPQQFGGAF